MDFSNLSRRVGYGLDNDGFCACLCGLYVWVGLRGGVEGGRRERERERETRRNMDVDWSCRYAIENGYTNDLYSGGKCIETTPAISND